MPAVVTKDSRIAAPIVLDVIPLTVSEAISSIPSYCPPENIPIYNPFSPPFAGMFLLQLSDYLILCLYSDLADFNNTVIRITFAPDEDEDVNVVNVPIAIIDDLINEAAEQVFIAQLRLISSVNPDSVDLTTRLATLCRIIDDDSKWNNMQ